MASRSARSTGAERAPDRFAREAARAWLPRALRGLLVGTVALACQPPREAGAGSEAAALPPIGLAVRDTAHSWCAAFPRELADRAGRGGLEAGARITIVFARAPAAPAIGAVVAAVRSAECPAAFAQPRWDGYVGYDLALLDTARASDELPPVALAVAGDSPWKRDADGTARADLDRDGVPEEARQCAADEGEHFTLWSRDGPAGSWRRRAHEYYDWGGIVERTCRVGEDGRDGSETGGTTNDEGPAT